jgi:hypothetical protein
VVRLRCRLWDARLRLAPGAGVWRHVAFGVLLALPRWFALCLRLFDLHLLDLRCDGAGAQRGKRQLEYLDGQQRQCLGSGKKGWPVAARLWSWAFATELAPIRQPCVSKQRGEDPFQVSAHLKYLPRFEDTRLQLPRGWNDVLRGWAASSQSSGRPGTEEAGKPLPDVRSGQDILVAVKNEAELAMLPSTGPSGAAALRLPLEPKTLWDATLTAVRRPTIASIRIIVFRYTIYRRARLQGTRIH